MAKVLITESILQDTADAIRSKSGSQDTMKPSEFAENIGDLEIINLNDYFETTIKKGTSSAPGIAFSLKKAPDNLTVSGTDLTQAFTQCNKMTTAPQLNTSNVTNMGNMFNGCGSLTSVPLYDTGNVTNMGSMFSGCGALTTLPLFNTSKVTAMIYFCNQCTSLTAIPTFDTSKVTTFYNAFYRCWALTTVPVLDLSSATSMDFMFTDCNQLTNDSLNNILASLLTATSYSGTKTLAKIGLSSTQATTCTTLSNWTALSAAGWTTGY